MQQLLRMLIAIAFCLGGCGDPEPVNRLVINLVTDLSPRGEFSVVRVERFDHVPGAGEASPGTRVDTILDVRAVEEPARIAHFDDIGAGEHVVRVRLLGAAGNVLIERTALVHVRGTTFATIVMTRNCVDVECPGSGVAAHLVACLDGRCVDPRCTPETPEYCPAPRCEVDGDCAGTDCADGGCQSGVCLTFERSGACADTDWCHPDLGCQRLEQELMDAGVDAGMVGGDAGEVSAPTVSGIAVTIDRTPTWHWAAGGGGDGTFRYRLDDPDLSAGATESTAVAFTPSEVLTRAAHTLYVQERGAGGGWSETGQATIEVAGIAELASGGGTFNCVRYTTGDVRCWGGNEFGQLGLGDTEHRGDDPGEMGEHLPLVDLGTGRTAAQIEVSRYWACAILDDATLKCWGRNEYGRLGLGDTDHRGDDPGEMGDHLPPIDLGTDAVPIRIQMGGEHACVILEGGAIKCWGRSHNGQVGQSDTRTRGDEPGEMGDALPAVDLGTTRPAVQLAAAVYHACAGLDDGTLRCWGWYSGLSYEDQLFRGKDPGLMGAALTAVPFPTSFGSIVELVAGDFHNCARYEDGRVRCWGYAEYGQIGLGTTTAVGDRPGQISGLAPLDFAGRAALAVSAQRDGACALLDDRTVRCWGRNGSGNLGIGDVEPRGDEPGEMGAALQAVDYGSGTVRDLVGGYDHACVVFTDHTVRCWGANEYGQLGIGDSDHRGDEPDEMGDRIPLVDL